MGTIATTKRSKRLVQAKKPPLLLNPQTQQTLLKQRHKEPHHLPPITRYPTRLSLPLPCLSQSQLLHTSSSKRSQLTLQTTTHHRMNRIHHRAKTHLSSISPYLG